MRGIFYIWTIFSWSFQDDTFEYYPSEKLTWSEGVTFCEEKGGALATFKNQDMLDQVCRLFFLFLFQLQFNALFPRVVTWLGATDAAVEGTWVFEGPVSDSEKSYLSFFGRNPDNNNGNEHCLALVHTKMNDGRCEARHSVSCRFFSTQVIHVWLVICD